MHAQQPGPLHLRLQGQRQQVPLVETILLANTPIGIQYDTGCQGAMETPQHGNVSTWKCLKTGFEEFPFFWEIPQNWKMLRDFRIFLRRFLIFKVAVFPLFF